MVLLGSEISIELVVFNDYVVCCHVGAVVGALAHGVHGPYCQHCWSCCCAY